MQTVQETRGLSRESEHRGITRNADMETQRWFESADSLVEAPGFTRLLLENTSDGIVACDADGRLILFNQVACEWFRQDLTGTSLKDWVKHGDLYRDDGSTPLPVKEAPLARAFRGERFSDEGLAIVASGEPARFLRVSGGPVMDRADRQLGAAVVMRDVTELRSLAERTNELEETHRNLRTELEKQQREQEQAGKEQALLRCILDSANDLIFIKDCDSVYRSCNRASEQFLGLAESDQIGKTDFDFFDHEVAADIRAVDRRVMETEKPVRSEEWVTYADGHQALMDTIKVPYHGPGGEILGLVGIARDITDRKLAEEALRESEKRLGEAARIAHVGYWDRDYVAETISLSEEACRIFGISWPCSFTNLSEWHEQWISLIHPEDQQRTADAADAALAGGPDYNVYYRVVRSDGDVRDIYSYAEVTRDASGKPLRMFGTMVDITERIQKEKALKKSEAKYLDLYENAPDMYASANSQTMLIEECNRTLAKTLGYAKEEIIGRPLFDIYHPDSLEEAKRTFTLFLRTGRILDKELLLQRKNGSKLDISLDASAVYDEEGRILFCRSTLRDITERKRNNAINSARLHLLQFAAAHSLDELLAETSNEAEKISDSLIGFYHFIEDDQEALSLQNWSAKTKTRFCKVEGKRRHHPIAQAGVWADCVYQRMPVIHNDYASLVHRKGMPEGHAEIIRELVVPVFRGERIKAILGVGNKPVDYTEKDVETLSLLADIALEIMERKRAEEKVLRSDQRLRLHSERSPLGFLEWDDKFRAMEWNAACEGIFGYTRKEAIGRHAKDLILPMEVHEPIDGFFQSLMRQTGGQHGINENVTKDGRTIICEWFNTTLVDESGKAIGVASVCRDITEQKRIEAELARYREDLEKQVHERTSELEIAKNNLRQRAAALEAVNRELEAFAFSVSHDLRAPLRHIDGFLGLLQKKARTALDEQGRHYMEVIADATNKMGRLIDDLLSFSRMSRHTMSFQPVVLEPLVRDIIRELEIEAAGRNVAWRIGDLPTVDGDASMLRIVLVNLISNALKFTRLQQCAEIEIGSQNDQTSETVIFVRDNGVGFDMTYGDKLFGVFQRLHKAEEFEGTGIGLATVHRIIARHGGRTWAQGMLDQGAAFYFTLPRTA